MFNHLADDLQVECISIDLRTEILRQVYRLGHFSDTCAEEVQLVE
jgi:hypothetical protein